MPQLVKGGKWVFGWVIVGPRREIRIPPTANLEYCFQAGEPVVFLRGSQRSGGFNLGQNEKIKRCLPNLQRRVIDYGEIIAGGLFEIPTTIKIQPGDQLLVVRGSSLALGFLNQGPIYEEALQHMDIETFTEKE
jgi:hypothetical protein